MTDPRVVVDVLGTLGGKAPAAQVRRATSRRLVRSAVHQGLVYRPRRGWVVLPVLEQADRTLIELRGVRSHLSAALHHGWSVREAPERPVVTIAPTSSLPASRRRGVEVHWAPISARELDDGVTGRARTVIDCARTLPYPDALAVADSALRAGVTPSDLSRELARAPRIGRSRATRVIQAADPAAANAFESCLRAICHEVPGLAVEPQLVIVDVGGAWIGQVDLADPERGVVIEAESWAYHGQRDAFARDVLRYTDLTAAGWMVLRFLWEDVIHRPERVRAVIEAAIGVRPALAYRRTA